MGTTNPNAEKQGGCGGCILAILGLCAVIAIWYYFYDIHGVQMLHAGDSAHFDPIDAFRYADELARDGEPLEFFQMTARFVRSDGTQDLTADYGAVTTYQWVGPTATDVPVGAGGGVARSLVMVRATDFGFELTATMADKSRFYDLNMGLRRSESWLTTEVTTTTKPTCKLADLWKQAITRGADPQAVAVVHYTATGYDFQIEGTPFHMSFGADCKPKK